jgi:hypothetical protein
MPLKLHQILAASPLRIPFLVEDEVRRRDRAIVLRQSLTYLQ